MKYYIPWKSISVLWTSAKQVWNEAWYEEKPEPPIPPSKPSDEGNGALDPNQTVWGSWVANQRRKKKKRTVELVCVVGEENFKQIKDASEEIEIGCKVNSVSLNEGVNHRPEITLTKK